MKIRILLGLLFFLNLIAFGQTRTMKTSVYFASDQYVLTKEAKKTLMELVDSLQKLDIKKIYTKGNTDNRADSLYNVRLSFNRTQSVTKYLIAKEIDPKLISEEYYGENKPIQPNDTDLGKQKNRRVDIIVLYAKKKIELVKEVESPPPIPPKKVFIDTCKGDTTILLENGTQLVFNRCEYFENINCLEITEVMTAQDAIDEGLNTIDFEQNPLASCGMIDFSILSRPDCNFKCFDKPVLIRFPVPDNVNCNYCGRGRMASLYNIDENGNWELSDRKIKEVKVNGKDYYQYTVKCPSGGQNCDCKTKYIKFKVKSKRKTRIVNVRLSSDCPLSVYSFSPEKTRRKNIIKKRKVPCYMGSGNVDAIVINEIGDTTIVKLRPLGDLSKNMWFARCKNKSEEIEKKVFGIFPYKKRLLYRKYKIKTQHLELADG